MPIQWIGPMPSQDGNDRTTDATVGPQMIHRSMRIGTASAITSTTASRPVRCRRWRRPRRPRAPGGGASAARGAGVVTSELATTGLPVGFSACCEDVLLLSFDVLRQPVNVLGG